MTATTREQRTERILVVEDEDAIRDLVATALRFTGFPVSTVASGRAAIAEIRNEPFDLLILDVNLPDIDGFEITRKIRADGNQVAVIFLTARDDLGDL
jgi:two-component system OmpR family response regulator